MQVVSAGAIEVVAPVVTFQNGGGELDALLVGEPRNTGLGFVDDDGGVAG